MELLLKVIAPSGQISLLPLAAGRIELDAAPGARYQLIVEGTGQDVAPRVMRLVDDLVIDHLPTPDEIQITGFFTACGESKGSCRFEVYLDGEGVASALVTPGSEPIAAMTGGGFLMAEPGAPASALPVPPEAESAPIWRPVMAAAAGVLVLGAAAGSGGGGAGDATGPARPVVASDNSVNTRLPEISGTAEPGSQVAVTLTPSGGASVRYATVADAQGKWSISTANDTPLSGTLPTGGLPENVPVAVEVVALDAAGNISETSQSTLAIDAQPPAAPTLRLEGAGSGSAAPVLNGGDLADGLTVTGTAEAGSTVTVRLDGTTIQQQTSTDAGGRFALILGGAGLSLADGQHTVSAEATDAAGNTGPSSSASLTVDASLSAVSATFDAIVDDRAPNVGLLSNGASSNDTLPTLRGEPFRAAGERRTTSGPAGWRPDRCRQHPGLGLGVHGSQSPGRR
ncbi:MAG: Ig-like domain-containing protein [Burkholderiaceae bacterium]